MASDLPDVYVRLKDLKGECRDDHHLGDDGWVQIKGFTFGFGLKGGSWADAAKNAGAAAKGAGGKGGSSGGAKGKGGPTGGAAANEGPLDFPPVQLTKSLDLASASIWKDKCHSGEPIAQVELEACRYGGTDRGNFKIPFLRLVFEEVYVESISLGLSNDELPAETITFTYDRVRMESLWTDNETGNRLVDRPSRAGWDKKNQKEWLG